MTKGRAKNLSDDAIGLIVGMLDGWSGKLTWDLFIDVIERRLRVRYTRQALDKRTQSLWVGVRPSGRLARASRIWSSVKPTAWAARMKATRRKSLRANWRRPASLRWLRSRPSSS